MTLASLFDCSFFTNAMIGIAIISVAAAMIGTYIISRRLVAISGGITHACFGGLGFGYFLGVSPIIMATVFAVGSSLGVEVMSSRYRVREDSAIAVVWAVGMAIGVIFVFLTPGYVPELNSFLFGNILTISRPDLWAFAIYTVILIIFFARRFDMIVSVAFDRDFARVQGLPVTYISTTMTVAIAICIVLTIKLVGIMLLMSMLSLPQLISEIFTSRFKTMMLLSCVISLVGSLGGLFLSAYINVPCSALIVGVFCVMFVVCKVLSLWLKR
ncbi:MAG: metal ABC transporter permease [Muribaculaceae bacterium]|nr:metal ABC transporter permease [Muribaculaceae bacterium]MDE7369702.1 metal ABC transporter permease [Muribaculaceae bacterium]